MYATAATTLSGLLVPVLGASRSGLGALPVLLVALACPLMMFVMMRSMSGMSHGRHDHRPADQDRPHDEVPDHVPDSWTEDRP